MEENKQCHWNIMYFYFKKVKNVTQRHINICNFYKDTVNDQVYQRWFTKFYTGDLLNNIGCTS